MTESYTVERAILAFNIIVVLVAAFVVTVAVADYQGLHLDPATFVEPGAPSSIAPD